MKKVLRVEQQWNGDALDAHTNPSAAAAALPCGCGAICVCVFQVDSGLNITTNHHKKRKQGTTLTGIRLVSREKLERPVFIVQTTYTERYRRHRRKNAHWRRKRWSSLLPVHGYLRRGEGHEEALPQRSQRQWPKPQLAGVPAPLDESISSAPGGGKARAVRGVVKAASPDSNESSSCRR